MPDPTNILVATRDLDALPTRPTGWTRHMTMHLNFGPGKGAATYALHDEHGRCVNGIAYGYRNGGKEAGFFLVGAVQGPEGYLTWSQLREVYAAARKQDLDNARVVEGPEVLHADR